MSLASVPFQLTCSFILNKIQKINSKETIPGAVWFCGKARRLFQPAVPNRINPKDLKQPHLTPVWVLVYRRAFFVRAQFKRSWRKHSSATVGSYRQDSQWLCLISELKSLWWHWSSLQVFSSFSRLCGLLADAIAELLTQPCSSSSSSTDGCFWWPLLNTQPDWPLSPDELKPHFSG